MTEYRVTIEIDIEASSPEEAAVKVESILRTDPPPFYVYKRDELAPGGIDTDSLIIVNAWDDGDVWEVHDNGVVEVLDLDAYENVHGKGVVAECGNCGRMWDDTISTGITPAPSGRCVFEYEHAAVS